MSNERFHSTIHSPLRIGAAISERCRRLTVEGLRALAFWAAVFLPLAYLPALYGVGVFDGTGSILALLVIHMACVVIGHEHNDPAEHRA